MKGNVLKTKLKGQEATSNNDSVEKQRTIVVSNVPESVSESAIQIHFQKKKNGGGDIEKVVVLPDNKALVVFENDEG